MVGFSEANKVERELKAEDEKWQEQLKVLQDSVQATVDLMSKEFDGAQPTRKKELQDNLSAWNQRVNNFKHANMQRMEKLRNEKMQSVADKVNVYLDEHGKKHNYSIIFGTVAGGSILYGDKEKYDITQKIINGLNERYK
jgi:Skp family chaperone for outer membrane proteins